MGDTPPPAGDQHLMPIADRSLALVVWGLGISQIVGFGTLYYSFGILAPDMARDFGWTIEWIYGALSAALLVGSFAAPMSGRRFDRHGAAAVMSIGSIVSAMALVIAAASPTPAVFLLGLIAIQTASGLVQYNAAFAVLVQIAPRRAGRTITLLTLIAGFASTLFWPLTVWLHEHYDWRTVYFAYAALNLLVCLPIHLALTRFARRVSPPASSGTVGEHLPGRIDPAQRRLALILLTTAFSLMGFVFSALLIHMVPMLMSLGLGAMAVAVGAAFGPSQVAARLINMVFGAALRPAILAVIAAAALPVSIAVLLATSPWPPGAFVFVLLLGIGSGLNSIVQGTLPLWMFGDRNYGTLVGRVTAARLVVSSVAPFVFSWLGETFGVAAALSLTTFAGIAAVLAFAAIARLRNTPAPD